MQSRSSGAKTRQENDKQDDIVAKNGTPGSYSEVAKRVQHNRKEFSSAPSMLIKNTNKSNTDVLEDVQRRINPAGLNVSVENVRKVNNGVIISCNSSESLQKLKANIQTEFGTKYAVDELKKFNPRMIVRNVNVKCVNLDNSDAMIKNIMSQNPDFEKSEIEKIKLVTSFKRSDKSRDVVIEVSPKLRKSILDRSFLYISWQRCYVDDYLRIVRCYKCSRYGHTNSNCKNAKNVCPHCADEHLMKDCHNSTIQRCVNCVDNNTKFKTSFDVNHSSKDKNCPTTIRLHDFDVVGVTETWLTSDISNDQIKIQNYDCYRCDRSTRGGGVALFVKSCYQCSVIMSGQSPNLEYIWIKIQSRKKKIAIGIFYRPPQGSVTESISMFDDMLALILPEYNDIVLTGDINIDLLKTNNAVSQCFDAYGLTQVITDPTRVTETTATLIDPLYLKKPDTCLRSGVINADLFSDHGLVFCELSFDHAKTRQKYITFRDFTKFEQETFDNDLYSIPWHEIIYMKNIEDKVKFITSNMVKWNSLC
nr:unnamed protein product [Callosobruchus analis]